MLKWHAIQKCEYIIERVENAGSEIRNKRYIETLSISQQKLVVSNLVNNIRLPTLLFLHMRMGKTIGEHSIIKTI